MGQELLGFGVSKEDILLGLHSPYKSPSLVTVLFRQAKPSDRSRLKPLIRYQSSSMKLVVDKFKSTGKWVETYEAPITLAQLDEFKYSFYPEKCLELFEKLSGKHLPKNNPNYALVIRLEDEVPENTHFIRYMIAGR